MADSAGYFLAAGAAGPDSLPVNLAVDAAIQAHRHYCGRRVPVNQGHHFAAIKDS